MSETRATYTPGPSGEHAPTRPSQAAIKRGGGDKREAIMAAALELFVERGFYGTAVPEIADKAGVGAGTIYRYFESKEALVNAIYRHEKLRFGHLVVDDFPAGAATREQFRLLWTRMATYAVGHPQSMMFLELHHHARYLDQESRALEERMTGLFAAVIANAQKRGDLKAGEPRMLMGIVMGAFVGVIQCSLELGATLDQANWALAEQCMWEAIRQ